MRTHRFAVGELACTVISDGRLEFPLADFFSPENGAPQEELDRTGRTEVTCGYNCLCVATPDGLALVDTGFGRNFQGQGPERAALVGRLRDGLKNTEPDVVVFTHLHEDHARGAAFPEAAGIAHADEVRFWSRSAARAPEEQRRPAREAIRRFGERLRTVEYGEEILPRVHAVEAAGHTPGHMALLLKSRGDRLLCLGDTFHDPLQLAHPTWCTPWDLDRERAVRSRRALLAWAADEKLLVHAYHLAFPGLGRIERRGDAYAWTPLKP